MQTLTAIAATAALGLLRPSTALDDVPTALLDRGGCVLLYSARAPDEDVVSEESLTRAMERLRGRLADRTHAVRLVVRDGEPTIQVVLPDLRGEPAAALARHLARPGTIEFRFLAEGSPEVDVDFESKRLQAELQRRAQANEEVGPTADLSRLSVDGFEHDYHWRPIHASHAEDWVVMNGLTHEIGQTHFALVEFDDDSSFDERSLAQVRVEVDQTSGLPAIGIEFTEEAGARFGTYTEAGIGRKLAVIIDGEIVSAPEVRAKVSRTAIITAGNRGFGVLDVRLLVERLKDSRTDEGVPCTLRLLDRVDVP